MDEIDKSELRIKLSNLEGFESPRISLEQYETPPSLAADMVFYAFMNGDIKGREVVDLGCGTGILGIGASLLGGDVTGVEIDSSAIKLAERNLETANAEMDLVEKDIEAFDGSFDTCLMNPPFSVHSEEAETFISKAFEISGSIYSIGDQNVLEIIKDFADSIEYRVEFREMKISLPPKYGFHTEEGRETEVNLIHARR